MKQFLIREEWRHGAGWKNHGIHEFASQEDANKWIDKNIWEQDEECWNCEALTIEKAIIKRKLPRGFVPDGVETHQTQGDEK